MAIEDRDGLDEEVHHALGKVFGPKGVMTVQWVIAVDAVSAEGERTAFILAAPESMPWDVLGLLHWAIQEQAEGGRPPPG